MPTPIAVFLRDPLRLIHGVCFHVWSASTPSAPVRVWKTSQSPGRRGGCSWAVPAMFNGLADTVLIVGTRACASVAGTPE